MKVKGKGGGKGNGPWSTPSLGFDLRVEKDKWGHTTKTCHTKVFVIMTKKTMSKTNTTKMYMFQRTKQNKTKFNKLLTI